jgi:hypothetical protein
MLKKITRYHVTFGTHKTTISVDSMLSALLSIRLQKEPGTTEAKRAVTNFLQQILPKKLGEDKGAARSASFWARRYIIEEIADPQLLEPWEKWFYADDD